MRRLAFSAAAVAALTAAITGRAGEPEQTGLEYQQWFTEQALRVVLIHSGTRGEEVFGLFELVSEPLWPGTRRHLLDPSGYGKYRLRAYDRATGREIFSRGYCTLFGEWLSTAEAADGLWRSMPEPLRMPMPRAPIILVVEVRDDDSGEMRKLADFQLDPTAYYVRDDRRFDFEVSLLHESERLPSSAVDIAIVPDGYTEREAAKMLADAERFTERFFREPPFDRHADEIAIRLVHAFSRESGPDEPRKGVFRDTVVQTSFDTFRSPRYLTTADAKTLAEVAALAPYDAIYVMVNSARYGGGGIYNSYSIFTSDSEYSEYVMIHEFGHGFGGLADEYFSASTGYDEDQFYREGVEPWEPNITAADDRESVEWAELIAPETPVPTPDTPEYDGVVGLFEGAGYKARGLYRPTRDSKMFHKGLLPFGPVNEAALERMIRYYTNEEME
ncbi:MAG: M64 family metallopeptidase [Polyangia bacterium]